MIGSVGGSGKSKITRIAALGFTDPAGDPGEPDRKGADYWEDLATLAERREEPTMLHEQFKADLKRDGIL